MRNIEELKTIMENEINRWTNMDSSEYSEEIWETYGPNRRLYNRDIYRDISITYLLENKIVTFQEACLIIENF
jgi:hypothetical protein